MISNTLKFNIMKRLHLTIAVVFIALSIHAQTESPKDTLWKVNGTFSLNFSQATLTNWAAGGENSISGNGFVELSADYDDTKKLNWDNDLKLGYGLIVQGDDPVRKSDDKIDLSSKLGYKISKAWLYSNMINFKTQFAMGYDRPGETDRIKISNFMAPGYLNLSTGFDWKPVESFSLMLSPVTGKFTFVLDDDLSQEGAFGVDSGQYVRSELGGYLKATFKKEIVKNVRINTKIDLFSNYLNEPQNIDVNWDLLITFKVNEFISASFIANLIYDHDIKFKEDTNGDGTIDKIGPRTQFKEIFGIGLTYSF